jgi:diguanylate cyclase (GGDEF)-like protein
VRTFRRSWLVLAVAVLCLGVVGSFLGALAVARGDQQRSHQAAATSSVEIAATLKLAIQRELDLAINTGAFVLTDPTASQAQFQQWVGSDRLFARFPELEGVGEVALVQHSQLSSYAEQATASGATGGAPFAPEPPGDRDHYCFTRLTETRTGQAATPPTLDVCDTVVGPGLMASRASGRSSYEPYRTGGVTTLAIGNPVYRGGAVPATVQARQDAFLGWVGIEVVPSVVLGTALQGHPDTGVDFRYGTGRGSVSFDAGSAPAGALTTVVDLENGWRVRVASPVASGAIDADADALALLVAGIALTLLLVALIALLATGRDRALVTVDAQTDELRHLALHDPLTGLPNRALLLDRLEQLLARGRRDHGAVAAFFIDLDDFKDINDTLGHAAGDQLLVAVGNRLSGALRQGDTVGRLGGDEFVVLAEGASLAAGPGVVADRLLDVLASPFAVDETDMPLSVTASIGYADGDRPTPERLLQDADIALYQAKAAGKAQAVGFAQAMRTAVDIHRHLEVELHGALESHQFFLMYQPTVDLSTGVFTGAEALLRWRHPERGVVMPDQFIPALESSGLIVPVGAWVLVEACRQAVRWADQGQPLVMSVNVSGRQLERDRVIDDVDRALSLTGLDPGLLVLELTETSLMSNVEASMERLQLLKALGVRIAIDDFGTGYSSLAYLRQFPIDVLKIDQMFVAGMTDSDESAALVDTLIQLGRALGLETVAEGVETDGQRLLLQAAGVDIGQGYLFARPMEVDGFERRLHIHGARPVDHAT